jgi:PAS domain S-box-containing protein
MDKTNLNILTASQNGEEAMMSRYQQLVEASADVMYTLDYRGYCVYVNSAVKRFFGYEPDEVIGRYFTDYIHPDWRDKALGFYMQQFEDRTPQTTYEFPAVTVDGEVKWVEQIVILLTDGDRVEGFLGFVRDISRRKQAEDRLKAIVDAVPDHIYVKDLDHRFLLVNRSTWQNEGFDNAEEMIGKTDFDLYGPDGKEDWEAETALFKSGEPIINFERLNPKPPESSQRQVVLINKVPLYDDDGEIIGLIGINRDITERKQAEDQLRQNVNTLRAMFETSPDLIFIKDKQLRYTLFNPTGLRMMGRALEDIVGKTDYELFDHQVGDEMSVIDQKVLETGEATSYEIERPLAEGNRWLLITKYPLLSAQGDVLGIVGLGHDITERKEAEAALQASKDNLLALMNNSNDSIFSMDMERRLITFNATFANRFLTNFGIVLYPGMRMEDHVPKKMQTDWVPWIDRALAGERFSVEYRFVSNGVESYTDINFNPIINPEGAITGMAVFNRDTTARKEIEAALIASEANLSALMENSTDSIFSGDTDMRIVTLNAVFKQRFKVLFGADIDVGTRLPDVVPPPVAAQWMPWYQRALAGESFTVEQQVSTEDQTFFFEITYNPIVTGETVTGVAVFSRDVSGRAVAVRALRESERRYRAVVDDQSDLISRSLPDTTITFVNDAYCEFFGKTREQLIGQSHLILSPESEHEAMRDRIDMWMKNPSIYTNEARHVMPDGEVRWIEWTDHALLNEKGEVIEFQSAGRDVTRRKLAEIAHLESEQRYRAVVEQQRDLVSRSTPDTVLTFVNDAYCRYFNKSREELIGHTFLVTVPTEYHATIRAKYADMVSNPTVRTDERYYMMDGEVRWLEWTNHAILDDQGEVVEFQSTGRDVTERKRAEDERNDYIIRLEILQRLDTELSQTLKLDYVLNVALDASVRISGAKAGAIHMVEVGRDMRVAAIIGDYPASMLNEIIPAGVGLIGRVARTLQPEWIKDVSKDADYVGNVPGIKSQITVPLLAQERLIATLNVQTSDPKRFTQQIFDFIKLLASRIASALDNANLHQMLQQHFDELHNVYEQVSDLEQLKSQIIRIAAHDLRNPLSIISGFLQVIQTDPDLQLPERTLGNLRIIGENADRIEKISRDILTLERVQRGIHMDAVDLTEMVRTSYNEQVAQATMKSIDFQLMPLPAAITVQGDSILLHETVSNLIGNALKYTRDNGRVVVNLRVVKGAAVFEVEDNGYGIAADKQGELFKPFYRVNDKETRHIPGSGLGLSLVKSIVERHDGKVMFQSIYGQGSTFGFELPLARKGKKKREPAASV